VITGASAAKPFYRPPIIVAAPLFHSLPVHPVLLTFSVLFRALLLQSSHLVFHSVFISREMLSCIPLPRYHID